MKKFLYISLTLLMAGMLWACSSEPVFPDPGFDNTRTLRDTVRRDNMDVYNLTMSIKVPNGVREIQLLDGRTNKLIETITGQYVGQTQINFVHPIDLTAVVERDSMMQYMVRVVDNDMRTINKGLSLFVRKFSFPTITVSGASKGVMGFSSLIFPLKAKLETGLYKMTRIRVFFEDVDEALVDEDLSGKDLSTYIYQHTFTGIPDMYIGQPYKMTFELTDERGEVGTQDIYVTRIQPRRPKTIKVYQLPTYNGTKPRWELTLDYDENNRLKSMYCVQWAYDNRANAYNNNYDYKYTFEYNETGMVSKMIKSNTKNAVFSIETDKLFEYQYDLANPKKLMGIETTTRNVTTGAISPLASGCYTMFRWNDDDRPTAYAAPGTGESAWIPIRYCPDVGSDNQVLCEYMFSGTFTHYCKEMTPVPIPTYFPELPLSREGTMMSDFQELFFFKYVFTEVWRDQTTVAPYKHYGVAYDTFDNGEIKELRLQQYNSNGTPVTTSTSSPYFYRFVFNYDE